MNEFKLAALVAVALSALAGCAGAQPSSAGKSSAVATLSPTQGNSASGTVTFEGVDGGVAVVARVKGLKPNSVHGFHVHEKGDCSSPDGSSAGGHFNPAGAPHGPQEGPHHAGDMPALRSDANGMAEAKFTLVGLSIGSGQADVLNRAVIVHAQPDDYKTQPTGNSGGRIACGIVGPKQP
jgi:Cu-Zn family superoxide dismutase